MKTIITLISSILIMSIFTQCGNAQFDKKAPFTITNGYYQDWFGGKPGSKGTIVTIEISEASSADVLFDSIFFNGKINKLGYTVSETKPTITGSFPTTTLFDKNIIMHADPKEEMVNKLPDTTGKFPFELTDNECVISYFVKQKKHYFKIENLQKRKPIYYP